MAVGLNGNGTGISGLWNNWRGRKRDTRARKYARIADHHMNKMENQDFQKVIDAVDAASRSALYFTTVAVSRVHLKTTVDRLNKKGYIVCWKDKPLPGETTMTEIAVYYAHESPRLSREDYISTRIFLTSIFFAEASFHGMTKSHAKLKDVCILLGAQAGGENGMIETPQFKDTLENMAKLILYYKYKGDKARTWMKFEDRGITDVTKCAKNLANMLGSNKLNRMIDDYAEESRRLFKSSEMSERAESLYATASGMLGVRA